MGLDSWLYSTSKNQITKRFGFDKWPNKIYDSNKEKIAYWRKHFELNAWMGSLYESKGGTDLQLDCTFVLKEEDLVALKNHIQKCAPEQWSRGGDDDDSYRDDIQQDLKTVNRALDLCRNGKTIYYYACW